MEGQVLIAGVEIGGFLEIKFPGPGFPRAHADSPSQIHARKNALNRGPRDASIESEGVEANGAEFGNARLAGRGTGAEFADRGHRRRQSIPVSSVRCHKALPDEELGFGKFLHLCDLASLR